MAFSEATKDAAYARSGGQCECRRQDGYHPYARCPKRLARHGEETNFHHVHAESKGGDDSLSNCEVLCTRCHKATESYGRH
jgi:5-methylcytosine-specific restriction endonuclease McrA